MRKFTVTPLLAMLTASMALWSTSCLDEGPLEEPEDEVGVEVAATTCGPHLDRYPIRGAHNGGWDPNATSYTCHPHPGSSPDNSDFIAGQHYGNDIFAARGTDVVSPVVGQVVRSGWNNTGGWRVTIRDGCGWYYYHAHLDSIDPAIHVGKNVVGGERIGALGNTGSASGTSPHLHFSIYPDDNYYAGIDPFPYLQSVDEGACGCASAGGDASMAWLLGFLFFVGITRHRRRRATIPS